MSIFKILLRFVLTVTSISVGYGLACKYLSVGDKISFQTGHASVNARGEQYPQISCKYCYMRSSLAQIDCIHNGYDQLQSKINWNCYPPDSFSTSDYSVSCEGFRQDDDIECIYENSCSITLSVSGVQWFLGGIDQLAFTGSTFVGNNTTEISGSITHLMLFFCLASSTQ